MKKFTAFVVTMLLLIGTMIYGVYADGFVFSETGRTVENGKLIVTWNQGDLPEGADIQFEEVRVGTHGCNVIAATGNSMEIDISSLPAGAYASVEYCYVLDGAESSKRIAKELVIPGKTAITLTMTFNENGMVTVKATDTNNVPVAGYTLSLSIGDMSDIRKTTDANGEYTSRLITDYGKAAFCKGIETDLGNGVVYEAAEEISAVRVEPTTTADPTATTTTATETTETTETTTATTVETTLAQPTQTTTTFAPIKGSGTTAVKGDRIAVNVSLDTNILQQFGLTLEDFDETGRLLLEKDDYSNLVQRSNSRLLMLNLLTAKAAPNEEQVAAAVNASSFTKYAADERKALSFDLSFLILDKISGEVVGNTSVPLNSTYIIQLPVPANMRDCAEFAVARSQGGTVGELIPVDVKNGYFQLQVDSLESYTVFGLGSGGAKANGFGGNSVWLVVLIVLAVLLLLVIGVFVYYVLARKAAIKRRKQRAAAQRAVPITWDENDIYSGRSDFYEVTRRPPSDR